VPSGTSGRGVPGLLHADEGERELRETLQVEQRREACPEEAGRARERVAGGHLHLALRRERRVDGVGDPRMAAVDG
jgi:hypothetical protein